VVSRAEYRLHVPGDEQRERPARNGNRDCEWRDLGEGPSRPPEALGPGVAEGARLELPGQQRRAGERSYQSWDHLKHAEGDPDSRRVGIQEIVGCLLADT
jgi:hypothetical protein